MHSDNDEKIVTSPEKFSLETLNLIIMPDVQDRFFMESVNQDIRLLNQLITSYNATETQVGRIEKLKLIYKQYLQIQNNYSAKQIAKCIPFQTEILDKFFSQLQLQIKINELPTITSLDESNIRGNAIPGTELISNLIANMPHEKLTVLQEVLKTRDFSKLPSLYKKDDPEYKTLQAFLLSNTIGYLGGINSKNFKIQPNNGSTPYVLKLENRMGVPKALEIDLRANLPKNYFTNLSVTRQSYLPISENNSQICNIEIGEFCGNGNLERFGKSMKTQKAPSALNLFIQMGKIVEAIRLHSCAFPDMKNSNWLIDGNGYLRLADSKSFLHTFNGNIMRKENIKQGYQFITTVYTHPPESNTSRPFSADKMHAFILGKNLYQYLTGCDCEYLISKFDASKLDFNHPEFSTEVGGHLKSLIEALVKKAPSQRMSVDDAVKKLQSIQLMSLKNECSMFLDEVIQLDESFEAKDFIQKHRILLQNAENPDDFIMIIHELEQYLKIHQPRDNCLKLLGEFENKEDDLYQIMLQKLNACDSNDKLQALHKELLIFMQPKIISDCKSLLQKIAVLSHGYNYQKLNKKLMDASTDLIELRQDLAYFYQYCHCEKLLQQIRAQGLGAEDKLMKIFLEEQYQKLNSPTNVRQLIELKKELDSTLQKLNNPIIREIKNHIQELSDNQLSFGSVEKADRIKRALMQLSIDERIQLDNPEKNEPILKDILKQMASHRHIGKAAVYLTGRGEIDEKKAASTYKKFKETLNQIKNAQEPSEEKTSFIKK